MSFHKIFLILVYAVILGLQACSTNPSSALPEQVDCTQASDMLKANCEQF